MKKRLTLYKSRAVLRQVFDNDVPSPVPQEAIQWAFLVKALDGVSDFGDASISLVQQLDFVATRILDQKPIDCTAKKAGQSQQNRILYSTLESPES